MKQIIWIILSSVFLLESCKENKINDLETRSNIEIQKQDT